MSEGEERTYELVQTPQSAVLNYLDATKLYVGLAQETAKNNLRHMGEGSKGIHAMEQVIQSLSDARGWLEDAMTAVEASRE